LDLDVIRTCQIHFPKWGDAWNDDRVQLRIEDGAAFVRNASDRSYDVIIQDSSDPWTVEDDGITIKPLPSSVLYERDHIKELNRILKSDGIVNIQAESFNVPTSLDGIVEWKRIMEDSGFARTRYGNIQTTSYPTGQIGFLLGEKQQYPSCSSSSSSSNNRMSSISKRYRKMVVDNKRSTSYYHPRLQRSCFDLPWWVYRKIYNRTIEDKDEEDASSSYDFVCQNNDDNNNGQ